MYVSIVVLTGGSKGLCHLTMLDSIRLQILGSYLQLLQLPLRTSHLAGGLLHLGRIHHKGSNMTGKLAGDELAPMLKNGVNMHFQSYFCTHQSQPLFQETSLPSKGSYLER